MPRKERIDPLLGIQYTMMKWRCSSAIMFGRLREFPTQSRQSSTPQVTKSVVRYPRPMPRNIIHSDVSVDPESESEALSIAPDAEEEPEVEPEEEEEEGEGEIEVDVEEEDEDGDEREEGDDGDEGEEEGEDADEPEEEEEDDEPADDGDGDAVQEVRTATVHHLQLLITYSFL
jgi:hypothetical protein